MLDIAPYQVNFSQFANRDQQGNALAWSLGQFRDKPVYRQILAAFVAEANELYAALCQLAQARTIAGATGVWLDGIGRIVGQPRENTPVDLPDNFFYFDDDVVGGYSLAVPTDTSAHFMEDHMAWVTGALVNANNAPTDDDYRDEIIRRIFQNCNQNSSVSDVQNAVNGVLGVRALIAQDGPRAITVNVPDGTPSWMVYYLTGKSFGLSSGATYNRWWMPYPACVESVTTGTYEVPRLP